MRFSYNIVNIIVIGLITGCLVDVVAVMGDVFILVCNFHVPLCNFVSRRFHIIVCRDGVSQFLIGINITPKNVLAQLIDRFVGLVDGSNTENRFLIIFSLFFLMWLLFFF
jgi:hypothetical protein